MGGRRWEGAFGLTRKNDSTFTSAFSEVFHADLRRFVGHLAPAVGRLGRDERVRFLAQLDLARHLAVTPRALALIPESVGPDALPILGRAPARRIEALLK